MSTTADYTDDLLTDTLTADGGGLVPIMQLPVREMEAGQKVWLTARLAGNSDAVRMPRMAIRLDGVKDSAVERSTVACINHDGQQYGTQYVVVRWLFTAPSAGDWYITARAEATSDLGQDHILIQPDLTYLKASQVNQNSLEWKDTGPACVGTMSVTNPDCAACATPSTSVTVLSKDIQVPTGASEVTAVAELELSREYGNFPGGNASCTVETFTKPMSSPGVFVGTNSVTTTNLTITSNKHHYRLNHTLVSAPLQGASWVRIETVVTHTAGNPIAIEGPAESASYALWGMAVTAPDMDAYGNGAVNLPDSVTSIVRWNIPDDSSNTATWPDRLAFYFNGNRTGYFNEYGEVRARAAKSNTTAMRGMGSGSGHTGYVLEGAKDDGTTLFGVKYDRVDATVPVRMPWIENTDGTRVYTGSTEPTSVPVGSLWFDSTPRGHTTGGGTASFVTANSYATISGSFNLSIPSATQAGDVGVAIVAVNDVNTTTYAVTPPAGWTLLDSTSAGSSYVYLYKKVVGSGDPGASQTWTNAGVPKWGAAAIYVRGGDVLTPARTVETVSGTTHASPTVNVTTAPTLLLQLNATKVTGLTTLTQPSGSTLDTSAYTTGSGNNGVAAAHVAVASNGTAGGGNWTANSASSASASYTIAVAPGTYVEDPPVLRRKLASGWVPALP